MYWLIIFLVLWGVYMYDIQKMEKGSNLLYNILLVLVIFTSSFAFFLGSDAPYYQYVYEHEIPTITELNKNVFNLLDISFNAGFIIFMSLCKTISSSYYFFKFVFACILNITIFSFIRKHTEYMYMTLLFYLLQAALYFNFEIYREALAICVFLWAYPYISGKQWSKYFLLCILAFTFHSSAIILFFVPLISILKVGTKTSVIIISIIVVILMILSARFGELIEPVMNKFDASFNKEYSSYLSKNRASGFSIGYIYSLTVDIIMPIVMLYIISQKRGVKDYYPMVYVLPLLVVLSYSVQIFFRFTNYFILYRFFFYVEIFDYFATLVVHTRKSFLFVLICCFYLTSIFVKNELAENIYGYRKIDRYYPYATIMQDPNNPARLYQQKRAKKY